jgi:hypothetical protein
MAYCTRVLYRPDFWVAFSFGLSGITLEVETDWRSEEYLTTNPYQINTPPSTMVAIIVITPLEVLYRR